MARGIYATLQNQTSSDPIPGDQEWLCSPREKQGFVPSIDRTHKQAGGRKGGDKILPGLLQPPLSGTKIQPQMEAYLGPQPSKSVLETRHLQNGNSGNNKDVSPKGGVGNVAGLQRRLFSHPHQSEVPEVSQVFSGKESLSIHGSSFRARHSSTGIYQSSQGGETDGSSTGYPDPPVPRRLVSQSPGPGNLPTTYPDPLGPVLRTRVGGKHGEIGTYASTGFQFRRLPVRSTVGSSVAHSGQMDRSSTETTVHQRQDSCSVRQFMSLIGLLTATEKQVWAGRLHMRPVQWRLKRHWHVPESLEKIIPIPLSLHPHLDWWLEESNVLKGQPLHPLQHALQIFTDASNEGWGAHLGGSTARGV